MPPPNPCENCPLHSELAKGLRAGPLSSCPWEDWKVISKRASCRTHRDKKKFYFTQKLFPKDQSENRTCRHGLRALGTLGPCVAGVRAATLPCGRGKGQRAPEDGVSFFRSPSAHMGVFFPVRGRLMESLRLES